MAHQKVMEAVMKQYAMLPVRFGTVGEGIGLIPGKTPEGQVSGTERIPQLYAG